MLLVRDWFRVNGPCVHIGVDAPVWLRVSVGQLIRGRHWLDLLLHGTLIEVRGFHQGSTWGLRNPSSRHRGDQDLGYSLLLTVVEGVAVDGDLWSCGFNLLSMWHPSNEVWDELALVV